jgi:histidinol-phosphate aminotransferase
MSHFDELVPEHIRCLGGYIPGKPLRQAQRESRVNCIKLASNENPFGPSPRALAAMQCVLAETNFYPDNDATELRQLLAERHQVKPEQVVVAAGSTSLLGIVARTLLAPGLNAVTSKLSFIVYPIVTNAAGAKLIEVPMLAHGFDLDAVADAVDPNTRMVFLANPNNPTGTCFSADDLDRFLQKVPERVIVILDEAYYDFAQYFAERRKFDYSNWLPYLQAKRNLVVLRTFSKAHGLAGLRVGYGVGPAELMSYFARMRTTFSVSEIAQAAAVAALADTTHIQKTLANNAEQSERLLKELNGMGYKTTPTWANFVYAEIGEDAHAFAKRMQGEGVIIRSLAPWGAPTAIRITVGTPAQNEQLLATLRKVAENASLAAKK